MTATPNDWDDVAIADFGEIVGGGTPSRATPSFWNGTVPWVTPTEITALRGKYIYDTQEKITPDGLAGSAARLLPVGSVVVTTRASLGMAAIASVPLTTNQGFKSVIPNKNTDSLFAYYLIQTMKPVMVRLASGTTFLEISKADFSRIRARRPKPEEQIHIAAVLDTVDEAIAKTQAVIAKLRRMRAGLLHDLLTRGLDHHGQLRDPIAHPEQFQDSTLGLIPKEWDVKAVGRLIAGFESGVSVDSVDAPVADGEIGVLKTGCVTGGMFNLQENKRVKKKDVSRVCCNPRADSLLISRMNTPQLVGESAYIPSSYSHLFLPDRLWQTIKLPDDPACIRWLGYAIQTEEFRQAITGGATGTSGSMKNISQKFFLGLPVRVPPRPEQELIAAVAIQQDAMIGAEQSAHDKLVQLKSGLMTDLLTGRIHVPESIGTTP